MDELVDHAGVALEIADQLFVMPAFLKRGEPELLIELGSLGHLA
jgi:hypothetical protein